jgi:hypothetical protein
VGTALVLLIAAGLAFVAAIVVWWRARHPAQERRPPSRYTRVRGRRVKRPVPAEEKPPRRSPVRAAFGISVALLAIALGVLFTDVEDEAVPEQRGVGLVAWAETPKGRRQVRPAPGRGMVLSAAVRVKSCGEPVQVSVFASGTAEFWIDHAKRLRDGGRIAIAIPDTEISDVEIALAGDGKVASISPLAEGPDPDADPLTALPLRRLRSVTVASADVPDWGSHYRPVVVSFEAEWLKRRSLLGSCYLRLPALAGFPTVLSAREIRGGAVEDVQTLECTTSNPCSIFTVSSQETGLEAYYAAEYETTRGLTSIELGSNALKSDLSRPAPDANVRGAPTWSCSTRAGRSVDTIEFADPERPPDILELEQGGASGAWSARQLGTAIGEKTCASFAVIEHASVAVTDDVAGLLIGALFSFGVGLFLEGTRRTRRAPD